MSSRRRLLSALTLMTLLFGNVSGWVHVGCHRGSVSVTESNPRAEDAHGGCPCHHHCSVPAETSSGEKRLPDGDHDSDHCSICQTLAICRDSLDTAGPSPRVEDAMIADRIAMVSAVLSSQRDISSACVRGPPVA